MATYAPLALWLVDVDAKTGAILSDYDASERAWSSQLVQGHDIYQFNPVTVEAEVQDTQPAVRMQYLPLGTRVFDNQGKAEADLVPPVESNLVTENGAGFFHFSHEGEVTILWSMQSALKLLNDRFLWLGVDGAGRGIDAYVNVNEPQAGPWYQYPQNAVFSMPSDTQVAYDVIGHEVFHAVESHVMGPPPLPDTEARALRESSVHEGGNDHETHTIELGKNQGTVTFTLNTFNVPDRMVVLYPGQAPLDTGCFGTNLLPNGCAAGWCCDGAGVCWTTINYSGQSTQMTVDVEPNCKGTPATEWWFTLSCP